MTRNTIIQKTKDSPVEYDVIIIGAGNTGLTAAALLSKKGKKVLVLEESSSLGGAARTDEIAPGIKVSTLSYLLNNPDEELIEDLELRTKYGLKTYFQQGSFFPFQDGTYISLGKKVTGTVEIEDAEQFSYYLHELHLEHLAKKLDVLLSLTPPTPGDKTFKNTIRAWRLARFLKKLNSTEVEKLTKILTKSVSDHVDGYFRSPKLKAAIASSGVIGAWAGPKTPGTSFVMAHHQANPNWYYVKGGMGAYTDALARAAVDLGAKIVLSAAACKIERNKKYLYVTIPDGRAVKTKKVISTIHPKRLLSILEHTTLGFECAIKRWNSRGGTVKINLVVDTLPTFTAHPSFRTNVHGSSIIFCESIDKIQAAFESASRGDIPEDFYIDMVIPTVYDNSLAPAGKHIVSLFTQWAPCFWADISNNPELITYAKKVISYIEKYCPNFSNSIEKMQVIGPYELSKKYGLEGGSIFAGELSLDQLFHMRPAIGYADFTTPMKGVYNASAATHGGGGVLTRTAKSVIKLI